MKKEKIIRTDKGITLIALVITIIVLLILAGVSIAMLTGENGILTQAQNAKNKTEEAQAAEENILTNYEDYINNVTLDTATVGEIVTEGNKQYSKNGTAIIPEGFAIVPGLDDVSQGLVISDIESDTEDKGNQFVWVPVTGQEQYVRNRNYADKKVSESAYTDIGYLPDGIQPIISDGITDEKQIGEINEKSEKDAVINVGGFYISRYEAGKEGTNTLVSKKGATVWTGIAQENCKITAKTFINNNNVKSALCSGIQWDVIMSFIDGKKDGTGKAFYVMSGDSNRHVGLLKVSGNNEADKVCNIYDLEGNCWEYIAEKNSSYEGDKPYTTRGGAFPNQVASAIRYNVEGEANQKGGSFRFVLYVK